MFESTLDDYKIQFFSFFTETKILLFTTISRPRLVNPQPVRQLRFFYVPVVWNYLIILKTAVRNAKPTVQWLCSVGKLEIWL